MAAGDGRPDLERMLERDLARSADRLKGPSPSPSQAAYTRAADRHRLLRFRSALRAAFSKAAISLGAAVFFASAGAAGAMAATGSPNPAVWGATMSRAVATCRGSLPSGQPSAGPCAQATPQAPPPPPASQPVSKSTPLPLPVAATTPTAQPAAPPTTTPAPPARPTPRPAPAPARPAPHLRPAPSMPPGHWNGETRGTPALGHGRDHRPRGRGSRVRGLPGR